MQQGTKCTSTNGCLHDTPSRCVVYDGSYLKNLNVLSGQNLTDILSKINDLITQQGGGGLSEVFHVNSSTISLSGKGTNDDPLISYYTGTQVNADWLSTSGPSQILNKPILATVATSGSYNDLINKPVIPPGQVNSDWNSTSGVSQILNKPIIDKDYVGLGNVDNTSDLNKPISIATQTSLNNKEDIVNKSDDTSLGNSDTLYPTQNAVKTYVDNELATTIAAYIPISEKEQPNGVATLDSAGYVPLSQLNLTTTDVPEGMFLYYQDARVQSFSDTRYVPLSRTLSVSTGMTGGGDLSTNRSFGLDFSYLDDRYLSGYKQRTPVRVATISNITLSGIQTIDGVVLVAGDRVLVKNQTTGADNGIYNVDIGTWTRSTDFDQAVPGEIEQGSQIFVQEGTINGKTGWSLSTPAPITVGTTPLTFIQYSGANSYSAGTGLTLTGNVFSAQTGNALWNANKLQNINLSSTAPTSQQLLRYDGTNWTPWTPNFLVGELDPIAQSKTITVTGTSPITVTGGAQTVGNNPSFTLSHATSGVTAGTYTKLTVNSTGHVTSGASLAATDIPSLDTSKITTGILPIARGGTGLNAVGTAGQLIRVNTGATAIEYFTPTYLTGNQTITLTGDITGSGTTNIATTLKNTGTPGTYRQVTTDAQGRVTSGANPTTLAGYGITDAYTKTQSDSLYKPVSYNPDLATVLSNGNIANSGIFLGTSGNSFYYPVSITRAISGVDYTLSTGITSTPTGTFVMSNGTAVNNKIILLPFTGNTLQYSPDNGSTVYNVWHAGNHQPGSAFNPDFSGARVLQGLQSNASGHIVGMNTRILTPADIGAVPGTSANFIQNQNAAPQTSSNFYVSGSGIMNRLAVYGTVGTFTGDLVFSEGSPAGANGRWRFIRTGGEAAGNVGSNLELQSLDNSGVQIGTPFKINRASGEITLGTINNESTDVDKFLVSNTGSVRYRTGTQVLSDIGAAPATGSGSYVQNTTTQQASSDFNISGTGRAVVFKAPVVSSGVSAGAITFVGGDNIAGSSRGAEISLRGGTYSTTPGEMTFHTGTGGGNTVQPERMRINADGTVSINSGLLTLTNSTSNFLQFASSPFGTPTFTTRSPGTRIILNPTLSSSNVDVAIGYEASNMWFSNSNPIAGFKWYAGTTNVATLSGTGTLSLGVPSAQVDGTLHVNGVAYIGGVQTSLANRLKISQGTGGMTLTGQSWSGSTWSQNDLYFEAFTTNFSGQVRISGGTPGTGKVLTSTDNNGTATWQTATAPTLQAVTTSGASTSIAIVSSSTVTATGFFNSSLRELKTNIVPFTRSALDIIGKSNICKFNYIGYNNEDFYGIIADEAPEELLSSSKESLNMYNTIGILMKAVQELRQEIKNLKNGMEYSSK